MANQKTLTIDIGGSGIKAMILDVERKSDREPEARPNTAPC